MPTGVNDAALLKPSPSGSPKVVGEEGTSPEDFTTYLKAEFLDAVYLQQNSFAEVDGSTPIARQKAMFDVVEKTLLGAFAFADNAAARRFFMDLQQTFIDWNDKKMDTPEFAQTKDALLAKIAAAAK